MTKGTITPRMLESGCFMNIPKMHLWLKRILSVGFAAVFCVAGGLSQDFPPEFKGKIDSLIVTAYNDAAGEFPCKVDSSGRPRMMDWKDLEKCFNDADERIDWDGLSRRIAALRQERGLPREDVSSLVEAALTAHAIPYSRVFTFKKKDALLPLSNTVLKFLPAESFKDLPVFDKATGKQIGKFLGVFAYEKSGGLSAANSYRLFMFQYTDMTGDVQTPALGTRLLLDNYGVPWDEARPRGSFRLSSNQLRY
jgi:hypothetical protein